MNYTTVRHVIYFIKQKTLGQLPPKFLLGNVSHSLAEQLLDSFTGV